MSEELQNLALLEFLCCEKKIEFDFKPIRKQLKALEIIRRYANKDGVNIDFNKIMKAAAKGYDINTMTWTFDEKLIAEYNLLREVLL